MENLHLNVDIRHVIFIFNLARYSAAGVLNILNQEVKLERSVAVLQWTQANFFSCFFFFEGGGDYLQRQRVTFSAFFVHNVSHDRDVASQLATSIC